MKTYYKNDLKHAYLILEGAEGEKDDYQSVMLRENEIPGILKTEVRHVDNCNHYYYDISGKTSFKIYHEKIPLSEKHMKKLVTDLLAAIWQVQRYMLDSSCILLEPEWIFRSGESYCFCYYPSCEQNIKEAFHRLTEFFVREVDYKDEAGVRFAYTLHKATMEDNYSIEEIMKEFLPKESEPLSLPPAEPEDNVEDYDDEEDEEEEEESLWDTFRNLLKWFRK